MTKTVSTRIKNKVANISSWNSSPVNKVDSDIRLLDGEIAIVRVPTGGTYTNPVTSKEEPVVELLMKVGDGSTVFSQLPWLSAKASDVYDWAKKGTATEIPVTVDGKASTLGAYLTQVNTNTTNIGNVSAKVDVTKVSTAISSAIDTFKQGLTHTGTAGTNQIVKAVTQSNGKVTVTYGAIAEAELPAASTSKKGIVQLSSTIADTEAYAATPKAVKSAKDVADDARTRVGAVETKLNGVETVTGYVAAEISKLDSVCSTSGSYVTNVTQTDGIVTVTKGNLPTADAFTAGIATLGANGGAATYASVFGTDGEGGINAQIETNKTDIANLKSAVAGGVHFRGTVTAKPTDASVTVNGSTSITAAAGDIVLWAAEGIEYIYTGSAWEQLGDVTRLGDAETAIENLEKAIAALDVSEPNAVATTHKFVSQVTQTDGKIAVTYTQPTSGDVSHESGTVATKFAAIDTDVAKLSDIGANAKVGATIDSKITDKLATLTHTGSTTGDFVTNVTQANGIVTVTKGNLPTASTAAAGIVKLNDTVTSTSTSEAATAKAVKTAYDKADEAHTLASGKANASHAHGNITNEGTLETANAVVVTDANKKIIASTTITTTELGYLNGVTSNLQDQLNAKGTSNLVIGTTATTAAAGNHNHDNAYADKQAFADVQSNYVRFDATDDKLYVGSDTLAIIFDCGGAKMEDV